MEEAVTHIQFATFTLGGRLFAVDIMRIREIIVSPERSPLPCASTLLEGVITQRGSVIPVMNMRERFGMAAGGKAVEGKLLIVALANQLLALAVDDVLEVITVPVTDITPPLPIVSGAGVEFLLGVCQTDGRVIMILDVDSLLGNGSGIFSDNQETDACTAMFRDELDR